jgi:hypothetical protein
VEYYGVQRVVYCVGDGRGLYAAICVNKLGSIPVFIILTCDHNRSPELAKTDRQTVVTILCFVGITQSAGGSQTAKI